MAILVKSSTLPHRLVDMLPANLEYLCLFAFVQGVPECLDNHVTKLLGKKRETLANFKKVEGVDEAVEDVRIKHGHDSVEVAMWEREERN